MLACDTYKIVLSIPLVLMILTLGALVAAMGVKLLKEF